MAVKQIIGSFEDIGERVVRETAKIPLDIAGMSPKRQEKQPEQHQPPKNPRAALEYFANLTRAKEQKPTVFDRKKREEMEKTETANVKKQQERMVLKPVKAIRSRGDLFGVKSKQTAVETRTTGQD